jgi:hypothetical protein
MPHSTTTPKNRFAFLRPLRSMRLGVHLVLLVLLKMAILTALWHALIKPYRVSVKADEMAQQLTAPVTTAQEK